MGALGIPAAFGQSYGSVMMVILAITLLQLIVRFMRVATAELLRDLHPLFQNAQVGAFIACVLGIVLVLTGWWQYLWILFGGANQLMASLALMLITAWLMAEGRSHAWTFYPMIFMFVTTIAALVYTSYTLLTKVYSGAVHGGELVGNTLMGLVGFFLVAAALVLGYEGLKAFRRYRALPAPAAGGSIPNAG
jgi:carbon starvation protein